MLLQPKYLSVVWTRGRPELNLVQLPSSIAAQTSAGPSEVIWGKPINSCSFGRSFTTCHTTRSVGLELHLAV